MFDSVPAAALRFRMLLVGIAAGLLVVGVISLRQMHNDALPELGSGPVLEVQTEALGLSSQEVEQYVTVPLENNLLDGVMGVWDVRSDSVPGLSSVDLYFEPGVSTLHARQLVEERLTNAFSLPNVSQPPQLIQPLSSSSRVMMVGLSSRSVSPLELSYLARWVIKPRLAGVAGVANVTVFGQRDRQMQVLVDPAKLAAAHVTLSQVIQTAGNAQLVSPLTYLEGSAPGTGGFLDGPNQRLEIRPVLPLGAPRNLAAVPIADAAGKLPLGSVASVVLGNQPLIGDAITRAGSGLVLLVQKSPSASTVGVTTGVLRALRELRPALTGVTIDTSLFKPASYVRSSIDNLALAAVIGAGLAILALLALLAQLRAAFVALCSIALALLIGALVLDQLGYTLNPMVVLGMLVALAVVADDAISGSCAVAIAAARRPEADEPDPRPLPMRVIEAYKPVRATLGFGTLIVLLCAAPAFFAHGLSATFVHPMLLAYALAVIASLVVAMTLTPALAMVLFERGAPRPRESAVARKLKGGYGVALNRMLAIRRGALLAVCLAGLVGIGVLPFIAQPSPPTFVDRNLIVDWTGPTGASLQEMDRITGRALTDLRALPSVADAGATLGRAIGADRIVDPNSGQLYVTIKPGADYSRAVAAVKALTYSFPGISARVSTYESDVIAGVLAPAHRVATVRVYGEDYGQLTTLAHRVASVIARVRGLGPALVREQTSEANIEVRIDDAAALRAGVLPGDARRQASTFVSGLTVGNFFQDQAVFDVVVRGVASARSTLGDVRNLLIDTGAGGHVRLGQIAQISIHADPIDVQHQALSRYIDVTAPVRSGTVGAAQSAIQSKLHQIAFPLDYHAEIVGTTPVQPTSRATFLSYVLAAAIGILLLLQAALQSWRLAALFFLALPVALSGALLVALATGELGSLGADAGLLAVYAIAARQGLQLIGHVRRMQALDGAPLNAEIVTRAATERLVPAVGAIVVTAVALIPFVALGNVAGNEITHVAAAVILGGLASSTILNVAILPAICLALGPAKPIESDEAAADREPAPPIAAGAASPT